jgi:acyl dehydratase
MTDDRKRTALGASVRDESKPVIVLKWEDINVGDELPPYTRYHTIETGIRHGKIYGDFYSGHVDIESSRRQFGVATMPIQGAYVHGGFTPFMVRWLRSAKPWICGGIADIKFIMAVTSGMTLRYCGKVIEKTVEDGKKYVWCEVWAENERGEKCAVGKTRACFQD